MKKLYRWYYNRTSEAPQVWSVDDGQQSSELNVKSVRTVGCETRTGVNLGERDTENSPRGWIEAEGFLVIEAGEAVIYGSLER